MDSLLIHIVDILSELASGRNDQRDDLALYSLSILCWLVSWRFAYAADKKSSYVGGKWVLAGCGMGLWHAFSMLILVSLDLHELVPRELALSLFHLYSPTLQFMTRLCVVVGLLLLLNREKAGQPPQLNRLVLAYTITYLALLWADWFRGQHPAFQGPISMLASMRYISDVMLGVGAILLIRGAMSRARAPAAILFFSFAMIGLLSLANLHTEGRFSVIMLPILNSVQLWTIPLIGFVFYSSRSPDDARSNTRKTLQSPPSEGTSIHSSTRHDLNNCLQSILTLSQLDKDEIAHPERVAEALTDIRIAAIRGGQVIKDVQ